MGDIMGPVNALLLSLLMSAISMLAIWPQSESLAPLMVFVIINGAANGGFFATMPTVVGSVFGSAKVAVAMGMIVTGWGGGYLMVCALHNCCRNHCSDFWSVIGRSYRGLYVERIWRGNQLLERLQTCHLLCWLYDPCQCGLCRGFKAEDNDQGFIARLKFLQTWSVAINLCYAKKCTTAGTDASPALITTNI